MAATSPSAAPPATTSPSAAPPATTVTDTATASPSPSEAPPATTATASASPSEAPPASPSATAAGRPHPSYTKMITQALAELGGTSGRAAIAASIRGRFTGLPATHDELLRAHLRRLVAEGVVRIYGSELRACYVFPASNTGGRGRPRKGATRLPKNLNLDDDDETIWPTPLASCLTPDWDPNSASAGRNSRSRPQQNSVPNLDGFQSDDGDDVAYSGEHDDDDDDDDDDEYTPARAHRKVNLSATKRGRGRPRKIPRGRGRPRKEEQQSQAKHPPTPTASTQKEQNSEAAKPPPASRGFKAGCGRPMLAPTSGDTGPPMSWRPIIIEKLPPARCSVHPPAASARVKRPRGRPRMYRPMPAETGDELENPVSVDVALENPIPVDVALEEAGDAAPAETEGAASAGIKRPRGRPRKEKPAAAMSAEAGDAASVRIKRGRGRPRKEKPAAAMSTEAGDAASPGIRRGRGRPRKEKPAAAMCAEAVDAVSTGMNSS